MSSASAYSDEEYPLPPLALIEEGRRHLVMRAPIAIRLPVRCCRMNDATLPWSHQHGPRRATRGSATSSDVSKGRRPPALTESDLFRFSWSAGKKLLEEFEPEPS